MSYGGMIANLYGMYSVAASVTPITNDWREWNGSADVAFTSISPSYGQWSQDSTAICVPIDAIRSLLVSRGYTNQNTSTYVPPVVQVVTLIDGLPNYGDPVELDEDANNVVWYRGENLEDGKIGIYYWWYNGSQNVAYAKVCNIDIDDNITFGARSVNIGPSSGGSSSRGVSLTKMDATHLVHLYVESGSANAGLLTTTINGDDTITVNSAKTTSIPMVGGEVTCLDGNIVLLLAAFNNHVLYALPSTQTVIGNPSSSIELASVSAGSNGGTIAKINATQAIVTFDYFPGGNYKIGANVVDYSSSSLTKGTTVDIANSINGDTIYPLETVAIGNNGQQVIATFVNTIQSQFQNVFVSCLTPSGLNFTFSEPRPINANCYDTNLFITMAKGQSALMSQTVLIAPYVTYDHYENFGLTVLNQDNIYDNPVLLYRLIASDNVTTENFPAVNGTGIIGSTSIIVTGDVTNIFTEGVLWRESDPLQTHEVISSSFGGINTTINFTPGLYTAYLNSPVNLLNVNSIATNDDGEYSNITYTNDIEGEKAILGLINGQNVIFIKSTEDSVALDSEEFPANLSIMNIDFMIFFVGQLTSGCMFDIISNNSNIYPVLTVRSDSIDLYPEDVSLQMPDMSAPLSLLTIIRKSGQLSVRLNGVETDSSNDLLFAIGSPIVERLFSNKDGFPAQGTFAQKDVWRGYSSTVLTQQETLLMAQYSIS